jgi:biopolymer transport protein TolR
MARTTFRRRKKLSLPKIVLTPLIDTALTLLVIFMVTTPMMNNAIKISLPEGKTREGDKTASELVVSLDKDGQLYLDQKVVKTKKELVSHVKKLVGSDSGRTVFVEADQQVLYKDVIELVDLLKVVGGVHYVALATKRTT